MYPQQGYQVYPYSALGISSLNSQQPTFSAPTSSAMTEQLSAGPNRGRLSSDTSSKDPEKMKARVFIGNLNTSLCSRNDLVELCLPYGKMSSLSILKGYAFVQYETQKEAEMAIKILGGYMFHGQKLDVKPAAMGKGSVVSANSSTGPVRRPKHDFLFGGQRIRVETTNLRNRTFSQEVFGAMKDVSIYNHEQMDTIICGSCRSVFTNIKVYIEHRRQKKCAFFEREVAPSVVSCFTCKEEFNEPWCFIQHLIHRHSINLYRGQPESDPITYLEKIKAERALNEQTTEKSNPVNETNTTEKSNGTGGEEVVLEPTNQANQEASTEQVPKVIEAENQSRIEPEGPPASTKKENDTNTDNQGTPENTQKDIPPYSSAMSIGVSASNAPPLIPGSSFYNVSSTIPPPSFHSQMSMAAFQPPIQSTYPVYQFTQPTVTDAPSMQKIYSGYQYGSIHPNTKPPMINRFVEQPNHPMDGGLSEEEQLRLLQEFALNNM